MTMTSGRYSQQSIGEPLDQRRLRLCLLDQVRFGRTSCSHRPCSTILVLLVWLILETRAVVEQARGGPKGND